MDAGVSGVPGLMSNSKAPNTCMGVSPSNMNPVHESYRTGGTQRVEVAS
jgi:hypothetical protein